MYEFPRAAVRKYHTLHGFKKISYSPTILEARILQLKCHRGHPPSEALREERFLAPLVSGDLDFPV